MGGQRLHKIENADSFVKQPSKAFRVTLVGPLPPPPGGMANQVQELAWRLKQEGYSVDVVQVNSPYRPHWVGRIRVIRAIFRLLPYLWQLWLQTSRSTVLHVFANSVHQLLTIIIAVKEIKTGETAVVLAITRVIQIVYLMLVETASAQAIPARP